MKITSLKRTSLVDQVEEKLREFILTQGLRSAIVSGITTLNNRLMRNL